MKLVRIRTPEYHVWRGIKQRCNNKNAPNYCSYGAKGIGISEEWENFNTFYRDMGPRPEKHYQIDRIDGSLGYFKDNCRWLTPHENSLNRKNQSGKYLLGAKIVGSGRFISRICIGGVSYYLGIFDTENEANEKYSEIYKEWYGKDPYKHKEDVNEFNV